MTDDVFHGSARTLLAHAMAKAPLALVRDEAPAAPVNVDAIALTHAHLRIDALEKELMRVIKRVDYLEGATPC